MSMQTLLWMEAVHFIWKRILHTVVQVLQMEQAQLILAQERPLRQVERSR